MTNYNNIFHCTGYFGGADYIFFVATSSQRMLLLSTKEESQLMKAYKLAVESKGDIHYTY